MSKLEKLLSQYAAYHLDHKNIVTHFVGIPLIERWSHLFEQLKAYL